MISHLFHNLGYADASDKTELIVSGHPVVTQLIQKPGHPMVTHSRSRAQVTLPFGRLSVQATVATRSETNQFNVMP